jgi:hypothetical protein
MHGARALTGGFFFFLNQAYWDSCANRLRREEQVVADSSMYQSAQKTKRLLRVRVMLVAAGLPKRFVQ